MNNKEEPIGCDNCINAKRAYILLNRMRMAGAIGVMCIKCGLTWHVNEDAK